MWLLIVLSVAIGLTLYLGWRFIEPMPVSRGRKIAGWLTVAVLLFGQRLTWLVTRDGPESTLISAFDWVGYTFLGLVSFLVILMLARDLPVMFVRLSSGIRTLVVPRSKRPYFIEPDRGRRRFLLNASNMTFLAATAPLSAYCIYEARRTPSVVQNELPVFGLPAGLDGVTIAQISDTHVGPTIRGGWMRKVVDEVMRLDADMIVHTGDMVDGSVPALRDDVAPLGDLRARLGVWCCTGNHEYYSGVEPWLEEFNRLGMRPLNNEHALIDTGAGRLLLGGVTDLRGEFIHPPHVSSPLAAMLDAPEHDVSVLLAHQPKSIYDASRAGFDIQLSGHTHGGQYFPWTLAIELFQPYVRGLHLHDSTLIYVNQGTGYWGPPMRLGAAPEITLHTLRMA